MNRTERFYKIHRLLTQNRHVPVARFLKELEVSLATFKRDIEFMRSRHHAPIAWDREHNGYCFTKPLKDAPKYELPGLWFNPSEIHALLTMERLLEGIDPGILGPRLDPLRQRLRELLESGDHSVDEVRRRIKVLATARRPVAADGFELAATALLRRRRIFMRYRSRASAEDTEREVSPQRLVHYRENWYLDAWCHLRRELRSFAVDAILNAEIVEAAAKNLSEKTLDEVLGAGYGIFSGKKVQWAKLKFSAQRARWVAYEQWHPRQKSKLLPDGSYLLEIPYSDDRELVMDILKHGPEVEVLAPQKLRERVAGALQEAAKSYAALPKSTHGLSASAK